MHAQLKSLRPVDQCWTVAKPLALLPYAVGDVEGAAVQGGFGGEREGESTGKPSTRSIYTTSMFAEFAQPQSCNSAVRHVIITQSTCVVLILSTEAVDGDGGYGEGSGWQGQRGCGSSCGQRPTHPVGPVGRAGQEGPGAGGGAAQGALISHIYPFLSNHIFPGARCKPHG